jgi:hypothetical protein
LSAFERIHLRVVSTLFVFVVERGADAIPDQPTKQAADRRPGQSVTGSTARDCCAKQRAGSRADQCPGVLFRTGAHSIGTARAGSNYETGDYESSKLGSGHFDPPEIRRLSKSNPA